MALRWRGAICGDLYRLCLEDSGVIDRLCTDVIKATRSPLVNFTDEKLNIVDPQICRTCWKRRCVEFFITFLHLVQKQMLVRIFITVFVD